jgi:2-C-methyl-D-erythritol 4-phosphate cytidylyltransferase
VSVVGIIAAGGSGERLGADRPKAFVVVGRRPMVEWSVEALQDACDRVIVAAPPEQLAAGSWRLAELVSGGESRSASVREGVLAAPEASVYVVHDAARPLVTTELVRRCIDALGPGVDGAIAAARMTDTVKEAGSDGRVLHTIDRSRLWRIQTPQVFRAEVLRQAVDRDPAALAAATDDASLVEEIGGTVHVVAAPPQNLKVTSESDLRVAAALLADR